MSSIAVDSSKYRSTQLGSRVVVLIAHIGVKVHLAQTIRTAPVTRLTHRRLTG